eukprot:Opistho-1_new@77369
MAQQGDPLVELEGKIKDIEDEINALKQQIKALEKKESDGGVLTDKEEKKLEQLREKETALIKKETALIISLREEKNRLSAAAANSAGALTAVVSKGFPPLATQSLSASGPSFNRLHVGARIVEAEFHNCVGLTFDRRRESMAWSSNRCASGKFKWSTEADIAYAVQLALDDICNCVGLRGHLELCNEFGVVGTVPDMWVLSARGRPVGVVEVKKPGRNVLATEEVAGQMYDYLKRLRTFYGLDHVFGIATTYAEWRICWLRNSATMSAASSSPSAVLSDDGTDDSIDAWWKHALGEPRWDGIADSTPLTDAPVTPTKGREICAGPVVELANHMALIGMVASALFKMLMSPTTPPTLASANRHYILLTESSYLWTTLPSDFKLKPQRICFS